MGADELLSTLVASGCALDFEFFFQCCLEVVNVVESLEDSAMYGCSNHSFKDLVDVRFRSVEEGRGVGGQFEQFLQFLGVTNLVGVIVVCDECHCGFEDS